MFTISRLTINLKPRAISIYQGKHNSFARTEELNVFQPLKRNQIY